MRFLFKDMICPQLHCLVPLLDVYRGKLLFCQPWQRLRWVLPATCVAWSLPGRCWFDLGRNLYERNMYLSQYMYIYIYIPQAKLEVETRDSGHVSIFLSTSELIKLTWTDFDSEGFHFKISQVAYHKKSWWLWLNTVRIQYDIMIWLFSQFSLQLLWTVAIAEVWKLMALVRHWVIQWR